MTFHGRIINHSNFTLMDIKLLIALFFHRTSSSIFQELASHVIIRIDPYYYTVKLYNSSRISSSFCFQTTA